MISPKTNVPRPDDPDVVNIASELARDLPGYFGSVSANVWRDLVSLPAGLSPDEVGAVIAAHLTRMVAVGMILERRETI